MIVQAVLDRLCDEFDNPRPHIEALLEFMADGAAPLFLARYRQEATGGMPLARIREIQRRYNFLDLMERRKARFFEEVEKAGKTLEPDLIAAIRETIDPLRFDDLTRPHTPQAPRRRRGRGEGPGAPDTAAVAPLLERILACDLPDYSLTDEASKLVDAKAGLPHAQAVLDRVAEALAHEMTANQDALEKARARMRLGVLAVRAGDGKGRGAERFAEFVGIKEPLSRIPAPKVMAILRGARERHLVLEILVDQVPLMDTLERVFFPALGKATGELRRFLQDVIRRALNLAILPAAQQQVFDEIRERLGREAVGGLQRRLRSLLMAPPFPGRVVMAVDPDLRRGSRLVVADGKGHLLDDATFRLGGAEEQEQAAAVIREKVQKHGVAFIAVAAAKGEGRDVKTFLRDLVRETEPRVLVETVSDAGARNWGLSPAAAQEMPDVSPEIRAVLSLARRVQDPLCEYVKLDPAYLIGAGQAMEIPPRLLRTALNEVIEECIAEVGPDVNHAPVEALAFVPGLDSKIGREIEKRRSPMIRTLEQLREVESVSEKVFRNCAGFLRLQDGDHPLDRTQIHPEHYDLVTRLAQRLEVPLAELLGSQEKVDALPWAELATPEVGPKTLELIRAELLHPGEDPRGRFETLVPPEGIQGLQDLQVEMKLRGRITRVAEFGIFVDVGVGPEGLVHEARIPRDGKDDPLANFHVGQIVEVRVVHVDLNQRRLALSMLPEGGQTGRRPREGGFRGEPEGGGEDRRGRVRRPFRGDRPEGGEGRPPFRPGRPGEAPRDQDRGRDRGRDRDRNRPRRSDRAPEVVIQARPVAATGEPTRTAKGELTSLSDLRHLLPPKPAPAAPPPAPPAGEPEPGGQETAPLEAPAASVPETPPEAPALGVPTAQPEEPRCAPSAQEPPPPEEAAPPAEEPQA